MDKIYLGAKTRTYRDYHGEPTTVVFYFKGFKIKGVLTHSYVQDTLDKYFTNGKKNSDLDYLPVIVLSDVYSKLFGEHDSTDLQNVGIGDAIGDPHFVAIFENDYKELRKKYGDKVATHKPQAV